MAWAQDWLSPAVAHSGGHEVHGHTANRTDFAKSVALPSGYNSAWFENGVENFSLAKVADGKMELLSGNINVIVAIPVTGGSGYSVTMPFHGDAVGFLQGANFSKTWETPSLKTLKV